MKMSEVANVIDVEKIIDDFPGLKKDVDGHHLVYLDNAATTLKPQVMVDEMNSYYQGISTNIHRGKNFSLEDVSNRYENVRYKVANLLSASGNEIVFLRNTTEAINLVAQGLELTKSDIVICFEDSHHSNILPWMHHADVRFVTQQEDGSIDIEHYKSLLSLSPTVVAMTHCSNVTGIYEDLDVLVPMAKEAGATVVVDGAQSVPHRKVDMQALDIDFFAFSAHKMMGPTGLGVLYGNLSKLETLRPMLLGGGMVDWVGFDSYRLRKLPHRLEAGTPNIAGVLGLGASIDYLTNIGFDKISKHDKTLGQTLLDEARKRSYLNVIRDGSDFDRGALVSFKIQGMENLDDIARYLSDAFGILCRNGHLCAQPFIDKTAQGQVLRYSAYLYNTEEEIKFSFESLDQIMEAF